MSWPAAMDIARQYTYMGLAGQVAMSETNLENDFLTNQLVQRQISSVWLAAGRDELAISPGIYLGSTQHYMEQLYVGTKDANGYPNSSFYSNFGIGQPDTNGGALNLKSDGAWYEISFSLLPDH